MPTLADLHDLLREAPDGAAKLDLLGRENLRQKLAKAYVVFTPGATPAITANLNCSSVAQNAAGDYTITWNVTLFDVNQPVKCTLCHQPAADTAANTLVANVHTKTATTTRVQSRRLSDFARVDPSVSFDVTVFGILA